MNKKEQELIFAPLIRVSTEAQKKRGESLDTQRNQLEKAVEMLGGKIYKWYAGQEHATSEQERKILGELMKDAEENKFKAVIVCDASRWSRDNKKNKNDLDILRKNGIRFFVGTTEYNLYDPTQSFMIGMNVEVSEYFAREQTYKSILNRIERAKKGFPSCGKLPYGRTFNKKNKVWEIDKEKKIRLEEIAKIYLEENIGFPELGKRFGMNGSNLDKILTKRCGEIWEQRFRSKAHNIDVIIPTRVPRLLDEETIRKIKNKAVSRKSFNHGFYKYEYLFNRIIFDADTGYALTGTPNSKGKRYYKPYQGSNAHRYMINADVLEKAVLEEFFGLLGCSKTLQEAVFDGNPIGKIAGELREKEKNFQRELRSMENKIENFTKAIENYEGVDLKSLLQKIKSESKNIEQKKVDLEFKIQKIQNQLSSLPTESEIINISKRMGRELLIRQKESYLRSGAALDTLPFSEKKKIILLFFSGKDEFGKKFGIYVNFLEGKPRRYRFKAYGKFALVSGDLEPRTTEYSAFSKLGSSSSSIENSMLNKEVVEIILNENPDLKIKEHIFSIDQNQPFGDGAFFQTGFHLGGDIDQGPAGRHLKP